MLLFAKYRHVHLNQSLVSISIRYCSNEIEQWKDIPGLHRYQVSSFGNFKNKKFGKLLKINYENIRKYKRSPQVGLLNDVGKRINVSIAKTILSVFHPMQNTAGLFATHINSDNCDNRLSNLQWNKCAQTFRKHNQQNNVPVTLQSNANKRLNFESVILCQAYLKSIGVDRTCSALCQYFKNKSVKFGYTFLYANEDKYKYKVIDNEHERWKLYATSNHGTEYWVSNEGRIKSVRKNKREKLMKVYLQGGYVKIGALRAFGSECVHKAIATCWVPNAHNYTMVDHIDTNIQNNHPSNLRWVENCKQNHANELTRRNFSVDIKLLQISLIDGSVIRTWDRAVSVNRELGFQTGNILWVCRGKRKTAYGFKWKFVD
eukprot:300383_1